MDSLKLVVFAFVIGLTLNTTTSMAATAKTAESKHKPAAKKDEKGRKPQNESACGDALNEARRIFAQEFGLAPARVNEVGLKFYRSADLELVSATHSEFCGARGCEYALIRID